MSEKGTAATPPEECDAVVQRPVRIQRDFAALRQEIENKNTTIRREIKAVACQIDRLRTTGDGLPTSILDTSMPLDVSMSSLRFGQDSDLDTSMQSIKAMSRSLTAPKSGEMAPKDPTTELVIELQTKLEAQQSELKSAQDALANAANAVEDSEASHRVLHLKNVVEEQRVELDRANTRLSARLVEVENLQAELKACSGRKALEDDSSSEEARRLRVNIQDQAGEIACLREQLFARQEQVAEITTLREQLFARQDASFEASEEQRKVMEAQSAENAALKAELTELEELQSAFEDMKVELATTKAQLVTRNLEMTKLEAQLVARNTELTKFEDQRAELASVKAQLIERDMKLVKQEVAMVLTDTDEASDDKECTLKARIALLEAEALANGDKIKRLEDDVRKRDEMLVSSLRTPRKKSEVLEALTTGDAGETLADELAQLAARVLSKNDALAERQLIRARAFLKVLREEAWAREATPSSFKLGKFLDDVANCLEPSMKTLGVGRGSERSHQNSPKHATRGNAAVFTVPSSGPPSRTSPAVALQERRDSVSTSHSSASQNTMEALGATAKPQSYWQSNSPELSSGRADNAPLTGSQTVLPMSRGNAFTVGVQGYPRNDHLRHLSPDRVTIAGANGSATAISVSVAPLRYGRTDMQDRTTEALLSSLQNSSSSLNYSTNSIGSKVPGSTSSVTSSMYTIPDREDPRNAQPRRPPLLSS